MIRKNMIIAILWSFSLSACGGQTIIINEASAPARQKLQPNKSVKQLQVVMLKSETCDKKHNGYSLANEELSGNSKICYYLSKQGVTK